MSNSGEKAAAAAILVAAAAAAAAEAAKVIYEGIESFGSLLIGAHDNSSPPRVLIYIEGNQVIKLHVRCHAHTIYKFPVGFTYRAEAVVQETGLSVSGDRFGSISASRDDAFLKLTKEVGRRARKFPGTRFPKTYASMEDAHMDLQRGHEPCHIQ